MFRLCLGLLASVVFISNGIAALQVEQPQPTLQVIDQVTVIDVENGKALPDQRVVVRDQVIAAVGPRDTIAIPESAELIPGRGLFLIPGLFDAHVHLTTAPDSFGPLLVAHGVTSVRDLGGPTEQILAIKREAADNFSTPTPDITATGAIIDGKPPVWPFSEAVETEAEAVAAVRKLASAGVDQIKVYSKLNREAYFATVAEAKRLGLKVTGHVPYSVSLSEAVNAGQDAIEHLEGFGPLLNQLASAPEVEGSQMIKAFQGWSHWSEVERDALRKELESHRAKGVVHVPTLAVMAGIGRISNPADDPRKDPLMKYVASSTRAFWESGQYGQFSPRAKAALPAMTEMVAELHRNGIQLAIGTDLANPYVFAGRSVHDEMQRFVEAGIEPAEVLRMATLIPAELCGVTGERGMIAPGKTASLVLLRANPLENINAIREVDAVWLRGRHFNRQRLDQLLAELENRSPATNQKDSAEVPPELPGEVVVRGRYRFRFQQFEAGSESFLVTKSTDGYHVWSHSKPQGGGQTPAIVQTHFSADGKLLAAKYRTLTSRPIEASYRLEDGKLKAEATRANRPAETAEYSLASEYRISTPTYATEFLFYADLGLEVGESKKLESIGFGFPDWKPAGVEVEVKRAEGETLEVAGKAWPTTVYLSTFTSPVGEMKVKTWLDANGHTLKAETKFPFGSLSVIRELEQD
jgi:imidazolonepropionase-like amidohydrolase